MTELTNDSKSYETNSTFDIEDSKKYSEHITVNNKQINKNHGDDMSNILRQERCSYCKIPDIDQQMKRLFNIICCNSCRRTELKFITKTTCKNDYLISEEELRQFKHVDLPNPRKESWNDMQLFLKSQIEEYALERYGTLEKIEELKIQRAKDRKARKLNKVKKNIKKLKKGVVHIDTRKKHRHKFVQKGKKGVCECGMTIEMEEI